MKPKAWSHSALEAFENCPRQYYETKIAKRWPFVDTKEVIWGRNVHKAFENYLLYDVPLPADMAMHQPFLDAFKAQPGQLAGEERIALDVDLRPCAYFAKDVEVWYRGQVDARKRNGRFAHILDHKTGKMKTDYTQLKSFAIWEFIANPQVEEVRVEFYWTQTRSANGETYYRHQLWDLLREFVPSLHRYADAHRTDTWVPKQSGLCRGWCPVTNCEFWSERRPRP